MAWHRETFSGAAYTQDLHDDDDAHCLLQFMAKECVKAMQEKTEEANE